MVYLELGDQRLNPDVTLEGDTLMATATATGSTDQEGTRELVCNVTLGSESRETRENVTVYSKRERGKIWGRGQRTAEAGRRMGGAPAA